MARSRDERELAHTWLQWHQETGRPLRSKFVRYVELSNAAARLNGELRFLAFTGFLLGFTT